MLQLLGSLSAHKLTWLADPSRRHRKGRWYQLLGRLA